MSIEPIKRIVPLPATNWLIHLAVIFLLVGDAAPGINESHYLVKAKHAWDGAFAPGDIFLESTNAHGLFGFVAGAMSIFFTLETVAWLGRLAAWGIAAWAWIKLMQSMAIPTMLSPLLLAGWHLAVTWGNWAGEWAVGGFEAKSLAYPLVIASLAVCICGRWSIGWILLGAATALHCLAGGWAALSIGLVWCLFYKLEAPLRQQFPAIILACAIALIGIVPAASGLTGHAAQGPAQIHTFMRLAHHLSPQLFTLERHLAGAFTLGMLVVVTGVFRCWFSDRLFLSKLDHRHNSFLTMYDDFPQRRRGILMLLQIAWVAVGVATIGIIIDVIIAPGFPAFSASLLRFYWFRWFDIIVPLTWVISLWSVGLGIQASYNSSTEQRRDLDIISLGAGPLIVLGLLSLTLSARFYYHRVSDSIPPADRRLFAPTPNLDTIDRHRVFFDWLAVCNWINNNTPPDSLWLTPRYQQTFKWYAGRAEIYSWKDVPQDNRSVLEWYDRSRTCAQPRDAQGRVRDWTAEELRRLSSRYGFRWVLIDRRFQRSPPLLKLVFPAHDAQSGVSVINSTYAVFYIPHD